MVCRNQVRIAIRLATVAALLSAVGVGYLLLKVDRLVTERVIQAIEKGAPPHWDVSVENVRLDGAQAKVFGLGIRPKGGSVDVITIPEAVVSLNAEALATTQTVIPELIELRQPVVRLQRFEDGSLNLDALKPWPKSQGTTVMTEISRATVVVQQAGQSAHVHDLDLTLRPTAQGQFSAAGTGRLDAFGDVQLKGRIDVAAKSFDLTLGGRLQINDRLMETVAAWHPTAGAKIAELSRPNIQVAAAGDDSTMAGVAGPASIGLDAETDLAVRISQKPGEPLNWTATSRIVRGQLAHPVFPHPLRGLTGTITVSENAIKIEELNAENRESSFRVAGEATMKPDGEMEKKFRIRASDVSLEGPFRRYLTPGLAAVHKLVNPRGLVDLVAEIDETGASVNRWKLLSFTVKDGAFVCSEFPYPVTDVRGEAKQVGNDVTLEFSGKAGTRDVDITGRVIDAGPGAGFDVLIATDGVPIDSRLHDAFKTPALKKVGETARSLELNGLLDGMVRVFRAPHVEKGTRPKFQVDVAIRDGSLRYEALPYRLEEAVGLVRFDDEKEAVWKFEQLAARRGQAKVTANGTFHPPKIVRTSAFDSSGTWSPGLLDLTFQVEALPYDREFYNAICHAEPSLKTVFQELNPDGTLFARDVRLRWTPKAPPELALPEVSLKDGRIQLASFPYLWTDVEATFHKESRSVEGDRITRIVFDKLSARHNDAKLVLRTDRTKASGTVDEQVSFAEALPSGWQTRFNGIEVRDWTVDQPLMVACPDDLRDTLTRLNIRRPINVAGDMLITSNAIDPFRFAARGVVDFPGNDLTAGVDLEGLRGRVLVEPIVVDRDGVRMTGELNVQQVRALDMAFTNLSGPVLYADDTLTLGSAAMVNKRPDDGRTISPDDRITAEFYGGGVGLDVTAKVGADNVLAYDIATTVADADLNLWAADNGLAAYDLQGKMNGEARFSGRADDVRSLRGQDGFLTISRARLLRLPALAQMTSVLNLRPPDETAFRYAYFNFDVNDGYFDFDRIDLAGNNLSFVGKGKAYFRPEDYGEIDFAFASYVPPNNSSIISKMWAGIGNGWIYVKLGGSIGNPVSDVKGRFALFDGLGSAMRAIESGQFVAPNAGRRSTTPIGR